jgi:hypothetical protein
VTAETAKTDGDKPIGSLASELVAMVIAYVKQETVDPIKSLGRFVAAGVAGAILIAVGGGLLTLAAVRAAQAETGRHLTGNLTWVPYGAGILVAGMGAAWAATRIGKGGK